MRLIVNTNRIIAALVKNSTSRKIIMSGKLELITPKFTLKELLKYRTYMLVKSKLSPSEFEKMFNIILSRIYFIDDVLILGKMTEAKKIMAKIDPADEIFIAAALTIQNDGIWSDDRHFMRQSAVKVYTTSDLLDFV